MVALNAAGNTLLSLGLHGGSATLLGSLLNPLVIGGIALLIGWTLARMHLLSFADLSFVVPVTAIGYVLNALIGRFFLGEHISGQRWFGTLLIMAGTALVGLTMREPVNRA